MWRGPNYWLESFCASGYENRDHGAIMARFVEVLEIKCIIPYLIDGVSSKFTFASLKLDDENNVPYHGHDVNSFAQTRDRILEINATLLAIWNQHRF